jgi:pimeloyl-ACP methyl ester carboxylesterase
VHPGLKQKARPLRLRRWLILALASALVVASYTPAVNLLFATRMLMAIRNVAEGATGANLNVIQTTVRRRNNAEEMEAIVYRAAAAAPVRAVVLVPGISELGCYHPRLMALSRYLAANDFLVVTPDIRDLRKFRMSPQAVDQIAYWFNQVPSLDGGSGIRITGLSGISFSATLAIIGAARPGVRERVSFVFGIGAYDDALRCSQTWFAPGPVTMSPGYYPTRYYARWIVMLGALDMAPRGEDRDFLEKALTDLLLLKPAPPPPPDLSQASLRWYRLAIMPEDQSDPPLAAEIEDHMSAVLYKAVSPEKAAAAIRCPVFLVHGAYDDLIPPEESRHLARRFVNAPVHLLVSPFLTHTHAAQQEPSGIARVIAVLEITGFFYDFAEIVR